MATPRFRPLEMAQVGEVPIREYPGFTEELVEGIEQKNPVTAPTE